MFEAMDIFKEYAPLFIGSAFLLGAIIGSFLNVVILRVPQMMEREWYADCRELLNQPAPATEFNESVFNLVYPPSHCPQCQHRLRVWENIPIISYLWLRGRCSACQQVIHWRYPAIELLTAVATAVVAWHYGWSWTVLAAWGFTWVMITLAVIDFETLLLPDSITLSLLWSGLLMSLTGLFVDSQTAILGASAGYLSLWFIFHLFRLFTGKDGMGHGDFKLFAAFGAWMGWAALPQIILLSAIPGAVIGILLIVLGRQEQRQPMPFGPFLACAGWIALLWGNQLQQWFLII
jgi:leader peptidase (prepilin peptidase)/N-methyltransferase